VFSTLIAVKGGNVSDSNTLDTDLRRLVEGRHHEAFSVLGAHREGDQTRVRVYLPFARSVHLPDLGVELTQRSREGIFEWLGDGSRLPAHYRVTWEDEAGVEHTHVDPYTFDPQIGDLDMHWFSEGRHWHAYRFLGAHLSQIDGIAGTLFAVWAPNAERVSVVGDFNRWDGRVHPMRARTGNGLWEIFIPGVDENALYKFELRNRDSGAVMVKIDPYARRFEVRPANAALVCDEPAVSWDDREWMTNRVHHGWQHAPMSIYEVHLGSWMRDANGESLGYRELAERLCDYVTAMGYTHVELLPVTEHPLDISWGYQSTGFFAPTSRFGSPDDFRYFVNHLHAHRIGVLLDWVPGHFPRDTVALARYDGTALYEHADPRQGEHRDWGTLIFNYGRNEVRSFLLSSALYWLEEFHIDGLRVDAVASMLYLDYSRDSGDWIPNKYGGRENLEAIDFLRELNEVVHSQYPGAVMVAEESTSWPQVSRPTWVGGLGFSMKWNMGWMNDTLVYFGHDPIYRQYHHNNLSFGLLYAFTENFILPFSHDEVVHGKGSLLDRMPGDEWQRFANLRLLYTFMFSYPGKKLLFMGCDIGQGREWDSEASVEWDLLQYGYHEGVQRLVRDLNQLYADEPSLHYRDFESQGFEWIDCHDATQSTLSYLRRDDDDVLIAVLNFTPVIRENFAIGVPYAGRYQEILNSDSEFYRGSNAGNAGELHAEASEWMGRPYRLALTLPPLAGILLRPMDRPASRSGQDLPPATR
jgi:1,4-alpha-glucan branching enzyme